MLLKELVLEKIKSFKVIVINEKENVVIPTEMILELLDSEVIECCKCKVNNENQLTIYINKELKLFDLPKLENYYFDEYYGGK